MKTIVFSMFLRGWGIRNHQIFHLEIIRNHACNPNLFFDASNARKHQKVTKNVSKWGAQNPWKIIKNLNSKGTESAGCAMKRRNNESLGTPEHVQLFRIIPNAFH